MKIELLVYIENLQNQVNRTIVVDENIKLQKLCEGIIVSMNGDCKKAYELDKSDQEAFETPDLEEDEESTERAKNLTLKDFGITLGKSYSLLYNPDKI